MDLDRVAVNVGCRSAGPDRRRLYVRETPWLGGLRGHSLVVGNSRQFLWHFLHMFVPATRNDHDLDGHGKCDLHDGSRGISNL